VFSVFDQTNGYWCIGCYDWCNQFLPKLCKVVGKAAGYDVFYRENQGLSQSELATVIISARRPRTTMLTYLGYQQAEAPGVYRSTFYGLVGVTVMTFLVGLRQYWFTGVPDERNAHQEE
jgi:hypothetical protein